MAPGKITVRILSASLVAMASMQMEAPEARMAGADLLGPTMAADPRQILPHVADRNLARCDGPPVQQGAASRPAGGHPAGCASNAAPSRVSPRHDRGRAGRAETALGPSQGG